MIVVSVKRGRLLSPGPVLNLVKVGGSTLGKNEESSDTWTSVGKQNGLVLFTEIFLNHRPSGIWGSYMDSPHLKQPTVHARGRFSGRSPFKPGDYPRQRPFFRTVTFQNRGPSTSEVISPDGQRLERDGAVQGDMPPPARGCLRSDWPCADRAGGGRRCRPVP